MLPSNENNTVVISKNNCPQCTLTKHILQSNNVPFTELNVEEQDNMQDYINYIKSEYKVSSIPLVIPVKDSQLQPWSNFRPDELDALVTYHETKGK